MQNVIFGFHAIEEALRSGKCTGTLYVSRKSSRIESLVELAEQNNIAVKRAGDDTLSKLAGKTAEHRGVLYVQTAAKKRYKDLSDFIESYGQQQPSLVLVLDGITDPQNLGAILRSADQFGVDLVLLPERRSAKVNTTVNKTSAGASSYVPVVVVKNLRRSISDLKQAGYWVYGADVQGLPLQSVDFADRAVLVMGAEGKGLSRIILEECDQTATIPTSGHVDSLNVSVAAGIILYEMRRP
ncbi:MAG: 23S rRNA (guanosine(2251)-2'-O)-methyltransferase RlmB [Spirochaetota bacterium]